MWFSLSAKYLLQEFFDIFFEDISRRPAASFEALAQDPPAAGFISRINPAKNNLVIDEKIDMRTPFKTWNEDLFLFLLLNLLMMK